MKRSTFLKSLIAIPVAVKALANVEAKPSPTIDPRILKNHDPSKWLIKYESVQRTIPIKFSDQMIADMCEIDPHLLGSLERSTFGQDIYSNIKILNP